MDILQYLGLGSSSTFGTAHPVGELQDMANMAHAHARHQQRIHINAAQDQQLVAADGSTHRVHSAADMLDMMQGGGTIETEMMQLDTLRLQRLAASLAPATAVPVVHDVGMMADAAMMDVSEHEYWGNDGRYEDDNVVWARRHDQGNLPSSSIPPSPSALARQFLPPPHASTTSGGSQAMAMGAGAAGAGAGSVGGGGRVAGGRRSSASELFFG